MGGEELYEFLPFVLWIGIICVVCWAANRHADQERKHERQDD